MISNEQLEKLAKGNTVFLHSEGAEMARELLALRQKESISLLGYVYQSRCGSVTNFNKELPLMPERWDITPVYAKNSTNS
ncbi:hypothetical protein PHYNN_209 [Pantoea phage Phynn]|nr:hypothetical protein PHYNN_209 [Pantoea phage Phynn]